MKLRVGMCPTPFPTDRWNREGNPFLILFAEALIKNDVDIIPIDSSELRQPGRLVTKQLDVIHLHWPASVFDFPNWSPPRITPPVLLQRYCAEIIRTWTKKLRALGKPLVWEVHDLVSHHAQGKGALAQADALLHRTIYSQANGLIFHEESCRDAIIAHYGLSNKPYVLAQLGDYSVVHGTAVSRQEARARLGISGDAKILTYIGTARTNRNPSSVVASFREIQIPGSQLIVAGQGVGRYVQQDVASRISVLDGYIQPDMLRNLFCASDFIINDAQKYLTSAVIREAIAYGIPVIAYKYGATIDMARGALLAIDGYTGGVGDAMKAALELDQQTYDEMIANARERNRERSWEGAGLALKSLYERVLK